MTQPLPEEFTIQDDFPPVSYEQWRALVEKSLQGAPFDRELVTHTYDGIDIQPLYSRGDRNEATDPLGFPGLAPYARGSQPLGSAASGWDLCQEHRHPDLTATNRAIRQDLDGGASSLLLRLDCAARGGFDPDHDATEQLAGRDGVMAYGLADLESVLAGVDLQRVPVVTDAGASFLPAAAALIALWQRLGVPLHEARGAFCADPLAVLARNGRLPVSAQFSLELMADLAEWTAANLPHVRAVGVDTSPYHDAGASAAQEIACGLATAVEYLRAMTGAGMDVDRAAQQIQLRVSLGTHHFREIAKLRAARWVWFRVIEACGGTPESAALRIHARTGNRMLTQRDPHINLLRNTTAVFAAGLGGADSITSVPFDSMIGLPDEFSRRVARNTALVLQQEAHLHRVIDPVGGSWFLDQLTTQMADEIWAQFQEIESNGGMLSVLQSGWIACRINTVQESRARDIARRKVGITGVSEFPDINEERDVRPEPDIAALRVAASKRISASRRKAEINAVTSANRVDSLVQLASRGASIGQMAAALGFHSEEESVPALPSHRIAEPFEQLRDASDAWLALQGQRPRIFMANFGPSSHYTARLTWSRNFFEAGGFEVLDNGGFEDAAQAAEALAESGANIAVICSSDKLYPNVVPQAAAQLKGAGADQVILAGRPGADEAAWRSAGVDRFIFVECDVLETLRALLREQGVLQSETQTS